MSSFLPTFMQPQQNNNLKEQFAQEQSQDTQDSITKAEEQYQLDPSPKNGFDLAQWLITSHKDSDKERGVALLKGLLATDEKNVGYLYFLASGNYKLQNYIEAKRYADQLLVLQPNNRQAMSLKSLAEEKVAKDGLIGMMIVGGAAAAVVSFSVFFPITIVLLCYAIQFYLTTKLSGALLLLKAKR